MGIKSLLPRKDFALAVVMYNDGDYDSLHQIVLSYRYLVRSYNHIHDKTTRDNLRCAAWEGLVEGIVMALDGRIPLRDLYEFVGPYASRTIRTTISKYWELSHFICIPARTIGRGMARPKVLSLDEVVSSEDNRSRGDMLAMPESEEPIYSTAEILELLRVTEREKSVLNQLLDGQKQKDIAKELGISKSNVSMLIRSLRLRAIEMGLDLVHNSRRPGV